MTDGPIDLMVLTFSGSTFRGDIVPSLHDLVKNGTIRVIDVLFVRKDRMGKAEILELADLGHGDQKAWEPIVSSIEGLLSDGDAEQIASLMGESSAAAIIVFEECWATTFRDKMQHSQVELLILQRVPQALIGSKLKATPSKVQVAES